MNIAYKIGISVIESKYPALYKSKKSYKVMASDNSWVVYGSAPQNMRGGGAPKIEIDAQTCKVVKISFAR